MSFNTSRRSSFSDNFSSSSFETCPLKLLSSYLAALLFPEGRAFVTDELKLTSLAVI